MATSSNLNTHYVSTVQVVRDCLKIVVYNSNYTTKYSIIKDGLENTYSKIREAIVENSYRDFDIIDRKSPDDYFIYKYNESNIRGFDIIIYLNDSGTEPLGYTQLNNVQGADKNINIKLNLSSVIAGINSIYLNNGISANSSKVCVGDELYDFTPSESILSNLPELLKSYTSNINDVLSNDLTTIYLSNGSVTAKDGVLNYHTLGVLKNRRVDPFRVGFDNFTVSHYKNDYALYEWRYDDNSIKYCIYSLTKKNKFSDLLIYIKTKTNDGFVEIPNYESENENIKILYGCGRFLVCSVNGEIRLLNTEYEDPVWVKDNNFILDQWGSNPIPASKLLPMTKRSLLNNVPKIYNCYINIEELIYNYDIKIDRKIGNWFLLKDNTSDNKYILAGRYSTVYLTDKDVSRLIVINDTSILIKEDKYYLLFDDVKTEFYTDRYLVDNNKSNSLVEYNNKLICSTGDINVDLSRKILYDSGEIKIIDKDDRLCDTPLNQYRKNSYPVDIKGIPDIIGACDGLIFYIDNKNINYL